MKTPSYVRAPCLHLPLPTKAVIAIARLKAPTSFPSTTSGAFDRLRNATCSTELKKYCIFLVES